MYSKDKPIAKYRKDYQPNGFVITTTKLDFDLYQYHAIVEAELDIKKNPKVEKLATSLTLNGEELELLEIRVDDKLLDDNCYKLDHESLTILKT